MNVDECCAICAEPLEWTGIGVCGHKETCSKCVARWRFVMKDKSCMVCKQECPSVYITRFMGDYTSRLSAEQYADLKTRANRGELYYLQDIEGFFDDPNHFAELKALCGYTHPAISAKCKEQARELPLFTSWAQMKKFAEANLKLHFCDICVQSRKVFLCEQLLYSKSDLDRHMKTGDDAGPMAESGFKGHPLCKFCRQRFYDSNELYRHMEGAHEHCFLCRRERPGQYVYYRHYQELEDHFRDHHHLCPHPNCMDKKFVVFAGEHELKRHFATEHGDELNMSRAQRRQALTIPINLQFGGGAGGPGGSGADGRASPPLIDLSRPGVVIGGGGGVSSRHGRPPMHHSRSEGQMQAALHASLQSAGMAMGGDMADASVGSVTFSAEDFPVVSAAPGGAGTGGALGRWTAAAGGGPSSSRGPAAGAGTSGMHHVSSNPVLSAEHFPALPSMTRGAKKKMKAQQASLADQLRAQNRPVRVINRAQGGASAPRPASATPTVPQHQQEEQGPVQQQVAASSEAGRASPLVMYEPPAAPSPTRGSTGAGLASVLLRDVPAPAAARAATTPSPPPLAPHEFPALPAGTGPGPAAPPLPPPLPTRYTSATLLNRGPGAGSSTAAAAPAPAPEAPPPPRPEDFPSLGQMSVALRAAAHAAASTSAAAAGGSSGSSGWSTAGSGKGKAKQQQAPATPTTPAAGASSRGGAGQAAVTAAAASAVQPGGVSESLKTANKVLIEKIKGQIADDAAFGRFRTDSGRFMRGELGAAEYHGIMVELGLLGVAAELAALCPVPARRDALMAAHKDYITSPALATPPRGAGGSGWVPPEAAIAAARAAEERPSWACARCTLINAPHVVSCEACGVPRAVSGAESFPSLSSVYGGGTGGSSSGSTSAAAAEPTGSDSFTDGGAGLGASGGKKKGKLQGTKITIGLGAGNARAAAAAATAGPAAWGGPAANASSSNPALRAKVEAQRAALANKDGGKSAWSQSGGNKLAKQIGAINDAWDRR